MGELHCSIPEPCLLPLPPVSPQWGALEGGCASPGLWGVWEQTGGHVLGELAPGVAIAESLEISCLAGVLCSTVFMSNS